MSDNQEKLNEQLFNVIANLKVSCEARLKKLKYLAYLGADVNTRLYGKSVLSKAIEKGAGAQVVEFLREKGANEWVIPKEEGLELSQGFWNDKGDLKSLEEIKELLKKGADVNASNKYGDTALMIASEKGHMDVVKCLAECGVDVNASNKYGRTALMVAAIWGQIEVVKHLAELGADLEAKDGDGKTALMVAASLGKLDVVKCLAELGADLEAKDGDGQTALMTAAINGQLDVVKYLTEQGADLNVQDKNGWTALIEAATLGNLDVVKCLTEQGADLDAKDKDGETVQDYAKKWRRVDDCVEFLEEYQKKDTVLSKANDSPKGGFWQRMFGGRD